MAARRRSSTPPPYNFKDRRTYLFHEPSRKSFAGNTLLSSESLIAELPTFATVHLTPKGVRKNRELSTETGTGTGERKWEVGIRSMVSIPETLRHELECARVERIALKLDPPTFATTNKEDSFGVSELGELYLKQAQEVETKGRPRSSRETSSIENVGTRIAKRREDKEEEQRCPYRSDLLLSQIGRARNKASLPRSREVQMNPVNWKCDKHEVVGKRLAPPQERRWEEAAKDEGNQVTRVMAVQHSKSMRCEGWSRGEAWVVAADAASPAAVRRCQSQRINNVENNYEKREDKYSKAHKKKVGVIEIFKRAFGWKKKRASLAQDA